jgi:hypothetical protein
VSKEVGGRGEKEKRRRRRGRENTANNDRCDQSVKLRSVERMGMMGWRWRWRWR